MKVYFVMFISDGRYDVHPRGSCCHIDGEVPFYSVTQANARRDMFCGPSHPWHGCYHVIETAWDSETGEIS